MFIDARNMGAMIDRRHRELTEEDINKISDTYHAFRGEPPRPSGSQLPSFQGGEGGVQEGKYEDIAGFCKIADLEEIKKNGYILTPGRYVGTEEIEEDFEVFEEKMKRLTAELSKHMEEEKRLNEEIRNQLSKIGFNLE